MCKYSAESLTTYILQRTAKVMIFQKRAKKCTESSFHIDNEIIKIVQNYTYLGTLISSTGNFSMVLDKLKEKALHALFSLRKHTNISKLSPLLTNKILDMMISPILTYNSEILGVYVKPDFKSWDSSQIEKNSSSVLQTLSKSKR